MTPDTLLKVFGPSSTSTDSTRILSGIFWGLPEVGEVLSERHDRVDVGFGVDSEVDQERPLGPLGGVHRRRDLRDFLDSHAGQAVGLRQLYQIRHAREVDLR